MVSGRQLLRPPSRAHLCFERYWGCGNPGLSRVNRHRHDWPSVPDSICGNQRGLLPGMKWLSPPFFGGGGFFSFPFLLDIYSVELVSLLSLRIKRIDSVSLFCGRRGWEYGVHAGV